MLHLSDIKEYLGTLMETFSSVLNLEHTVLQAHPLERIAATGIWFKTDVVCYEDGQLVPVWKNSYTMKVIETGKPFIVLDAKAYVEMHPKMNHSVDGRFYSILAYPIFLRKKLEGVLVTASFDEQQHRILTGNLENLKTYMEKLTELISGKLEQEILMDDIRIINCRMNSIIETMEDGVLLYSPKDGILQSNLCAKKYLHFDDPVLKNRLLIDVIATAKSTTAECPARIREIHETVDGFQYVLQLQTKLINDGSGSVLCIVSPFSHIQNSITQNEEKGLESDESLVFASQKMRRLVNQAKTAAQHATNVLITGESGTGKEMFARLIHSSSPRKSKPFVAVNCAAIPETLMESELFGYEEGAFTGARRGGKIGKIQLANGGTFFLDEIGDMPLYLQSKLLRVLSERKIERIGSSSTSLIDVDVRIIAATNQDLEAMISRKEFREDLYYRLNVVPLRLPPLREREDDIPFLVQYFINKYDKILQKNIRSASGDVMKMLMNYSWPGNVRELENCVEYMMTFEENTSLSVDVLPQRILDQNNISYGREVQNISDAPLKKQLHDRELEILHEMAAKYGGHPTKEQIKEICVKLDISVASYYRKISES